MSPVYSAHPLAGVFKNPNTADLLVGEETLSLSPFLSPEWEKRVQVLHLSGGVLSMSLCSFLVPAHTPMHPHGRDPGEDGIISGRNYWAQEVELE